ncbi:hypothetical protein [Burkholderia cepacia]|uniref:hypothetical protein n=1 Tax=Burkholderia cepacia TaxID=292 RepID=UPI0012D92A59|nr:hypothetical protein [Burkholderia cepacia]
MSTQNEKSPLTRNASGQENGTAIEARGLSSADNGMPAENLSQRKIPAPEQASDAANQRPSKENATAESIVGVRAAGGNGTSSKVGRADALTEETRQTLTRIAEVLDTEGMVLERDLLAENVRTILAASPVEQPAVAPIDSIRADADRLLAKVKPGELLPLPTAASIDSVEELRDKWKLVDGDMREGEHGLITYHVEAFDEGLRVGGSKPAPSPADERAAFEWPMLPRLPEAVVTTADGEAVFTAHQMQGYANAYGEMVRARATAANETGAEGTDALAHEVWSAAQLASAEGIENGVQRIAAILSRSPTMATEPVRAWETDDGRVITDEQKQQALRDGGASASSVRPFSIALGRIGAVPAMAAEAVAKIRVSHLGHHAELESYVARSLHLGVHEVYAAPQPVSIPAGWKAMPPSATTAMRMAMAKAAADYMQRTGGNSPDAIYEAGFTAAPQPPAQVQAVNSSSRTTR